MDKTVVIERIVVGPFQSNCYLIINRKKADAVLIDAGDEPELIKQKIREARVTLKAIFLTHGHIDHIGALCDFKLPTFIHEKDIEFLKNSDKNMSSFLGLSFSSSPQLDIRPLCDGQIVNISDFNLHIIHTPGHTPGSISIQFNSVVFSGDTLFAGGIGRTDLPYSSTQDLIGAIKDKLLTLADDTQVYPGHGDSTTIGEEKSNNPFIS